MFDNYYRLKDKSDTELHERLAGFKPHAAEYITGIQESMRRVACIQELMDKNEAFVRKRELIATGIAILSLAVAIIILVPSF